VLFLNYWHLFVTGAWVTIWTSTVAFAIGLVLGTLFALARRSRFRVLRLIGTVYVEILRNTPALVQIFIAYFGFASLGFRLPALLAGITALGVNAGAYLAEIIRAGIASVPPGQLEAARTLGLSPVQTFFSVVLPQATRTVFPPVVNQYVETILGSSLLSAISVQELTAEARIVNSITYETLAIFAFAMIFYLILTNLVSFAAAMFSRSFFKPRIATSYKFSIRGSRQLRTGGGRA